MLRRLKVLALLLVTAAVAAAAWARFTISTSALPGANR